MDIVAVSSSVAAPIADSESFGTFGSELARGYQ